ncbi:uncharacterized protein SCHCODRAFT_02642928 [Schizophyllum commune H4-8]|uniref:uncharacterized protein n=1 Tax=Schizophyllum commune (strain H4-8 / FGSC 9210) TaxID=578458 RepID=UPI00216082DC|nr:uncharacterized protein SCHCODRAFT_02642927 [Schizophyllum commune H4-8]XP_050197420.1 uncharacterized protein SCHCODRAFT_02642928 [Schizophyllum commune H4-8]KAI5885958.1 hypothetical protein SCHCODRAFT_02642927 [Schizophyllum commune H4-8]KAI5885960.1 hypothetical protein SCHCODRAFT_02642928 [Schizophyllum commune H4-8]
MPCPPTSSLNAGLPSSSPAVRSPSSSRPPAARHAPTCSPPPDPALSHAPPAPCRPDAHALVAFPRLARHAVRYASPCARSCTCGRELTARPRASSANAENAPATGRGAASGHAPAPPLLPRAHLPSGCAYPASARYAYSPVG